MSGADFANALLAANRKDDAGVDAFASAMERAHASFDFESGDTAGMLLATFSVRARHAEAAGIIVEGLSDSLECLRRLPFGERVAIFQFTSPEFDFVLVAKEGSDQIVGHWIVPLRT